MELALKNLKMTVDHAAVVRDLARRSEINHLSSPVRRDNRFMTNSSIKRLELELEKVARSLQSELVEVQQADKDAAPGHEAISIEMLEQVEGLFSQVDEYFQNKVEMKKALDALPISQYRNYREIKPRVDTGLSPLKKIPAHKQPRQQYSRAAREKDYFAEQIPQAKGSPHKNAQTPGQLLKLKMIQQRYESS